VGIDDAGSQLVLVVYVDRDNAGAASAIRTIPAQYRGVAVRVEVTEKFRALVGKPGGGGSGVSHKAIQTPAIQLGTSGGWKFDLANGYCCGGTLGSLVKDTSGKQYILSNYHVLEADIVLGGNNVKAANGQPVVQPALIDVGCDQSKPQTVGTLRLVNSLPVDHTKSLTVDCAVAEVAPDMVDPKGRILEIGEISSATALAFVTQPVKKSGRTTALTKSKVSGLNATVRVAYENECAGGSAFTQTFVNQIVIANRGSSFLNGGDSGSLMVEDKDPNPKAVGLLFAGSSTSAIANPIDEVLSVLGSKLGGTFSMVGAP
jgi:hypothetical protein